MPSKAIFVLYGPPVPWAAPQRSGNRFYSPNYKRKQESVESIKGQLLTPLKGAIKASFCFHMAVPKSLSEKKKQRMIAGQAFHVKKPDVDNLSKFVSDVLQMAGVFENDSQICQLEARKEYGALPMTVIQLEELAED